MFSFRVFIRWYKWLDKMNQFRDVFGDYIPNSLGNNVEIFVDESMSHTDYPFPWNLRVFLLVLSRNLTSRPPYYLNLSHNRVLREIISLELIPCCFFGKLSNLARRKEHVQASPSVERFPLPSPPGPLGCVCVRAQILPTHPHRCPVQSHRAKQTRRTQGCVYGSDGKTPRSCSWIY